MIAFRLRAARGRTIWRRLAAGLREDGFRPGRSSTGGMVNLADRRRPTPCARERRTTRARRQRRLYVVVDRLAAGSASDNRLRDSLETAFAKGRGRCYVFVEERQHESCRRNPTATPAHLQRHGSAYSHRRPPLAAARLQHAVGLRGLRHRVSAARAAAVQFQQPAGGVSRVRRFRQRDRHRHGPGRARSEQVAPRRGHRAVEHAGLRPRIEGTAGAGRATTTLPVDVPFRELSSRASAI